MNLEDTMLNEVKQAHKGKYCVIPLKWSTKNSQIHGELSCQGLRIGEKSELLFNGNSFI